MGIAAGLYPQTLLAQSNSDQNGLSALVSRQQQRMDLLEEGIKDVRGTIETELQNIRTELETLAASSVASQSGASSDFKSVQGELVKLADNIAIVSQRINNTLDLYSDIEFLILLENGWQPYCPCLVMILLKNWRKERYLLVGLGRLFP